jgi:hypothetical protein
LAAAAELRNCSRIFTDSPRVFHPEATYKQRGIVRRQPGWPHDRCPARGWEAPPCCVGRPWPLSGSCLVLVLRPGKIRLLKFVSSNSENISCIAFLKHKNSRK